MRDFTPKTVCKSLICLLMFYISAQADYHYVSHTGTDNYPYTTWETAADSIQKAINSATAGDTIYVGSGVWADAPYNLWNGISLIGIGIDSTILRKPSFVRYIWTNGNNLIQGLTIDGVDPEFHQSWVGIEMHLEDTAMVIKDNKFINLYTGLEITGNTGEIKNNIFSNNTEAIDASFEACNLSVKNNVFSNNASYTIHIYGGQWFVQNNIFSECADPLTFLGWSVDTAYIANNLFYGHLNVTLAYLVAGCYMENNALTGNFYDSPITHAAVYASSRDTTISIRIVNDAISGFVIGVYTQYIESIANLSYNSFWNVTHDDQGWGQVNYGIGNIHINPMFDNPDSGDFCLQMYSPLIDAGDPNILDYDGTRSDIGAFGGPGGYFYQYLDLPPHVPDSLSATIRGDSIIINWRMNTEADFYRYIINRDTVSGFTPWAGNIIAEPESSLFIDTHWDRFHNYYYKIAAYDNQLNLSPNSAELGVFVTSIPDPFNPNLPQMTEISTNYPNPFNNNTIIKYYLANLGYQPAEVKLYIYNISGQLVSKLVDEREYPGMHEITWDGTGEGGEGLSSGIYFARLIVSGIELQRAKKITLLK